jgi:hypothetical protein
MKRRKLFKVLGMTMLFSGISVSKGFSKGQKMKKCDLQEGEIQHMVIFNLPYSKESEKAIKFLDDGTRILTGIPVVQNFQAFNQVSTKNKFQYGFSMVFANGEDYQTYNNHPNHVSFVQDRWMKEVTDFLEIDFEK